MWPPVISKFFRGLVSTILRAAASSKELTELAVYHHSEDAWPKEMVRRYNRRLQDFMLLYYVYKVRRCSFSWDHHVKHLWQILSGRSARPQINFLIDTMKSAQTIFLDDRSSLRTNQEMTSIAVTNVAATLRKFRTSQRSAEST